MLIWRKPYAACVIAAVLVIGGAGTAFGLYLSTGKARPRADVGSCGLVTCAELHSARSASHAGRGVAIGGPASTQRSGETLPPTSATPMPRPSPGPASGGEPTPGQGPTAPVPAPASATVAVAYSTPQVWETGFQGEFTITNHGSATLTSWRLVITLPGDKIDAVWNADGQTGGAGTVVLTPASYDSPIKPGGSQPVDFTATGPTTQPASCTFNGSSCS